jgi:spermidine/putrescine transport system substrate-binding protein
MHPRQPGGAEFSRRELLRRFAVAGMSVPPIAAVLAACGNPPKPAGTQPGATLGSPKHPSTLPLFDDNPAIEDGLAPEKGATLQLFDWADYLAPKVIKAFCDKFGCDFDLTTFNSMAEAEQKMTTGQVADVFWPSAEVLGRLVRAKLLQPLNQTYIPNISNVWPIFSDPGPWYDQGWRYTVPYELFSTGIGYRRDVVNDEDAAAKGYELLWDPAYKGQIGVLDVYRETIGTALLRNGAGTVDSTNTADLNKAGESLKELVPLGVRVNIDYYANFAQQYEVRQGWGTDFTSYARFYIPKDISPDVVGFWFPPDGSGAVANDQMVIPANAPNPVLAHEFLNFLLDKDTAMQNFASYGYPAPMDELSGPALVDQGLVPKQLEGAIMTQDQWAKGNWITELPPDVEQKYVQIWQEFTLSAG